MARARPRKETESGVLGVMPADMRNPNSLQRVRPDGDGSDNSAALAAQDRLATGDCQRRAGDGVGGALRDGTTEERLGGVEEYVRGTQRQPLEPTPAGDDDQSAERISFSTTALRSLAACAGDHECRGDRGRAGIEHQQRI